MAPYIDPIEKIELASRFSNNALNLSCLESKRLDYLGSKKSTLNDAQTLRQINWPNIFKRLSELNNLTTLNLSGNSLTQIPEFLSKLKNLTYLDLSSNDLCEFPGFLFRLENLQALDLASNNILYVPSQIKLLKNLRELHLDHNPGIKGLSNLSYLDQLSALNLSRNDLERIPNTFSKMLNLRIVILSGNLLKTIPAFLFCLTSIQRLDLSSNLIGNVPAEIALLKGLEFLNLRNNPISILSEHAVKLPKINRIEGEEITYFDVDDHCVYFPRSEYWDQNCYRKILFLSFSGIQQPPPEILNRGSQAIQAYYRQLEMEGTEKLYEAKLLVVGEAFAGKTTLAKKIQDPSYNLEKLSSTEGIDILRWQFIYSNDFIFRVNIWDFGGQEIYHATHQFFLTKRSCYTLVADNRKEDDNLHYWLSIIELLASDSPVLIIKNEKGDRQRSLNENQLRGEFPQLKDSLTTNLATNRGLDNLLNQIRHHLSTLPHIGDELPKTWVRVRQALEDDPRNTIPLTTYLQLCVEHGFKQRKDALQLSQYLHDLGVFLHFQDDDLLSKTIILKPTWGTDAVYKVLDNPTVTQNQGCFTRQDLNNIWSADEYIGLQGELLQLMMKFQLCYELSYRPKNYIAPQLLNPNQPAYRWNETQNLILRYAYDFMPKGILTRFIVATHRLIAISRKDKRQVAWRTGVVLIKDGTLAEITELYGKREIKIRLQGSNKRGLLEIITYEIDRIHSSFNRLNYKQLIPCNCNRCLNSQTPYMHDLQRLKRRLSKGQETVECDESYDDVDVRSLIDDSIGYGESDRHKNNQTGHNVTVNVDINQANIDQNHSGSGDNVASDKNTNHR